MKKLISVVAVLVLAAAIAATAAFAAGPRSGLSAGTGYSQGLYYTDLNGDGVCDHRTQDCAGGGWSCAARSRDRICDHAGHSCRGAGQLRWAA